MLQASPLEDQSPVSRAREHAGKSYLPVATTLLLICGLMLRIYFFRRHVFIAGDSVLYQDIARNWLHKRVYGLSEGASPRPTLIRLPGYPAVLAALDWIFGRWLNPDPGTLASFLPVLSLQILADLGTCWISAGIARKVFGKQAFLITLALACLCPFSANYTVVPLTEVFTLFFLAAAFRLLQLWLGLPSEIASGTARINGSGRCWFAQP